MVIVDSVHFSEQNVWIGATDEEEEGTWVFTDGSNYPPTSVISEVIHTQR